MERYESLGLVGEGSYGAVLKCRHRDSGRLVAIKKFMDSDEDGTVKKIALREIKLLRQLRHDNLVNLLEVWRRRRRWYLVFEFVERTLLQDLEQHPSGLDLNTGREYLYQILRAAAFCHQQNIIHRDIKPENVLISQGGVVKLCDFGFARTMASPGEGGVYTDYVATRWYRAPELLVGDTKYGKPVDVWAVGCLLIEILTGQPLFPGDSDLDQIYHIVQFFGNLTAHHQELFYRNPVFSGVRVPECSSRESLEQRFPGITPAALDLAQACLHMEPERRAQCSELLEHPLFMHDSFQIRFLDELNAKIQKDHRESASLPKITKTQRRDGADEDERNHRGKGKKVSEGVDEEDVKDKEKKERKEEAKVEKVKGKQPSKLSTTTRNISEPLMSTKPSQTGTKFINNAAKMTMTTKIKPEKGNCAELRKEHEISKSTKTLISDSLEATKNTKDLRNDMPITAKAKHGKVDSPEPKESSLKNLDAKDSSGLQCCSNAATSSENAVKSEPRRSSYPEPTQDTEASKMDQCSITDDQNWSSPPKSSLESPVDETFTSKMLKMGPICTAGECAEEMASNPKPTKTTSNTDATMSKTFTTSLSAQLSRIYLEMLKRGNPKLSDTDSVSVAKPTNDTTRVLNKCPKGIPTSRERVKGLVATKNQQQKNARKDHDQITHASGRDYEQDLKSSETSSIHQQRTSNAKMTMESRAAPLLDEIPKTLRVSDKENREDSRLSVYIIGTTKHSDNQASEVSQNSEQTKKSSVVQHNVRSLKSPPSKSLTIRPKAKLSNHNRSTAATTSKTFTEAQKKSDDPERNDAVNMPTAADSISITSNHGPSTRNPVLHSNVDTTNLKDFDFSENLGPSPSPPPQPPSSTPLFLPPSLIPSLAAVAVNNPAASDHLGLGSKLQPRTHSLRGIDKLRHPTGVYGRVQQSLSSHTTASLTAQAMERSLTCEWFFPSDHHSLGNGGTAALHRRKSDIHFPDLRRSVLPQLRAREGKYSKFGAKDQRTGRHPGPFFPPSDPQQHRHTGADQL